MDSLKLVQEFVVRPTQDGLRAWHKRMGFTYDSASEALGMSRSAYGLMLAGQMPGRKIENTPSVIDRRTALACLAIEAGLSPFTPVPNPGVPIHSEAPKKSVKRRPKNNQQE